MTVEADDHALVELCLRGNRGAFASLVDKYEKTVFNLALRITHDYASAQDVAQSAFLKAFEGLRSFDPRYKFFSWLYRITINEALNTVGRDKQIETLKEDYVTNEDGPEAIIESEETAERVLEALEHLKIEYRVVIILKHLQNLSYSEIAQILEIPEKKVKSRLFTARIQLKDVLIKKGLGKHG